MGIKPLGYEDNISQEEAESRLQEAGECFKKVCAHYTSKWPRFGKKKVMSEDDNKVMAELIALLLPFGMQKSVQEQFRDMQGSEGSLLGRSTMLMQDILCYMAEFENIGVTRVDALPF